MTAIGGTTTGTWESPPFTYSGAGGEEATTVSFALDRRASVDQLLAVAGNAAEYTVRLIDVSEGGEASALIPAATLAGANSWTDVTRGSIDPDSLTAGHDYRIQITSRYTSGTSVLVTGNADYDNVVLDGIRRHERQTAKAARAKEKATAAVRLSEQRLMDLLRQATPGTAVLGSREAPLRPRQVPAQDRPRLPDHGAGPAAQAPPGDRQAHGAPAQRQVEAGRAAGQAEGAQAGRQAQAPPGAPEGPCRQADRDRRQEPAVDPAMSGFHH